jgi:predicted AlkP superfamily pyrophosphatase or phosphodiesterase
MCAGLHPEQTNLCFEYQFRPDGKTFHPALFNLLSLAERVFPPRYLRLGASAWLRMTSRDPVVRQTANVGTLPFNLLPLFDYAEKRLQTEPGYLDHPTIYDLLRRAGQRFLYYGFARPKDAGETIKRFHSMFVRHDLYEADQTMVSQFERDLRTNSPDFTHLHFSMLDWIGHKYGPSSSELMDAIGVIDGLIRRVVEIAQEQYRDVRLLISADHGMVEVQHHHDLDKILADLRLHEPEDYLSFRDSTVARFWFFTPQARDTVTSCLESIEWGRVLNEEDKRKLHIRFPDNANGDLLFLLNAGHVILPNYYQDETKPPLGMHGYDPTVGDNQGSILLHNPPRKPGLKNGTILDMVDIFPTLLDLHGLEWPGPLSGRSVLRK